MLSTIGRHEITTDLVDVLLVSHRRIRDHLALARRLAVESAPTDEEVRRAAERIRRYFTIAFPLHIADEEQTIAPRLAALGGRVAVTVATVADEHSLHRPLIKWFVTLIERIERQPEQLPALRDMLTQTIDLVVPMLELHLDLEEHVVFPALRRLPATDQAELLTAIRHRRTQAQVLRDRSTCVRHADTRDAS